MTTMGNDMDRYSRQINEIGAQAQAKIGAAHAVVIGAGGLGCAALPLLAGAGVGRLTIVDGDQVELSNLHRQTLFTQADIGASKAQAAARALAVRNETVQIAAHDVPMTPANGSDLIRNADVVLDCADSYGASYTLSDLCLGAHIPLITGSALGRSGYVAGVCGGGPSLRALFPDAPSNGQTCATGGIMGPVVSMIGALQAQMALACLIDAQPSPLGQMMQFDGAHWQCRQFRFDRAPEPAQAFVFIAPSQIVPTDAVFDLRDIDMTDITPPSTDRRMVLTCATGLRAWRAAEALSLTWPGEIVLAAASIS